MRKFGTIAGQLLSTGVRLLAAFAIVEGAASTLLLVKRLAAGAGGAVRQTSAASPWTRHMRFDGRLGWVNRPGAVVKDAYGPGIDVRNNAQGFRGAPDTTPREPEGKYRVLCSGDSFTFGEGVRDEETWCHYLSVKRKQWETVNLGQPGYGSDQAYLRYERDGGVLEHRGHIFSIISHDLARMAGGRSFFGAPKPFFRLAGDEPSLQNVPVPPAYEDLNWIQRHTSEFNGLRSVELFRPLLRSDPYVPGPEENRRLFVKLMEKLSASAKARGIDFLVVQQLDPSDAIVEHSGGLQDYLKRELGTRGIVYLDLAPRLEPLTVAQARSWYLPDGHLSARGNERAAEGILEAYERAFPAVSASRRGPAGSPSK